MKNGPYELITPPGTYPGKRYRGRYAYAHRVEWWKKTGLNPDDFKDHVVHHGNDIKRDNRQNNLEKMSRADHTAHHAKPPSPKILVCLHCATQFVSKYRKKQKFCSRRCIGLYGFNKKTA